MARVLGVICVWTGLPDEEVIHQYNPFITSGCAPARQVTKEEGEMSSVESATPTAVVLRIFERLNDRDADALLPFVSDDVVEVWPVIGRFEGKEAVRDYFAAMFAAVPDLHIDMERMAADGETVFAHWHMTGTFTGAPFVGIEATGRSIDLRGTDCFTVRDEKVVANFVAYDGLAFAVQAGILPPRGSRMDHAMTVAVNWMTRARKRLRR